MTSELNPPLAELQLEAVHPRVHVYGAYIVYQNVRGGKLSRFSWILAKRKCFTIETFPALQLENNYRLQ